MQTWSGECTRKEVSQTEFGSLLAKSIQKTEFLRKRKKFV